MFVSTFSAALSCPGVGLARRVLLGLEKPGIGEQHAPDQGNPGRVDFVVNESPTMTFNDPPDDSDGVIVFSARKDDGVRGVYVGIGPDLAGEKLVEEFDVVEGRQLSSLVLAKGNDWDPFVSIARDELTLDRQVWPVTPVPAPEPEAGVLIAAGTAALASLARAHRRTSPPS